ncbi:MAG TPA: GH92 family glycosyl hydrolase [Streptosporangiaceae bacterium]|nr:GH92 family glycosyl hydrolase [Streptosporangiaceae bacterium]
MARHARRRRTLGYTTALLATAGVLAGGWEAAPAGRQASASLASNAIGIAVKTCSKTSSGLVTNCPRPVSSALLPAGARNNHVLVAVGNPATLVDTRTWTSGGGNTYPGAQAPFGMIQWSPDTLPGRADGGGYTFGDKKLDGYSLTHISGPGCPAAGDIPILPMTGNLPAGNPSGVATSFTNKGEKAQAGFYSAASNMPQTITSSFSATPHAAIGSFRFPRTKTAHFLIKLRDSEEGVFASHAKTIGKNEVAGDETSGDFCNETTGQMGPQRYTIYFDIVFSQPFTGKRIITEPGQADPNSVFLTFNTTASPKIVAKVAISYVSEANAALNLRTEIPGWNLSTVQAATQNAWNSLLGEIDASGGSYSKTQEFYSLLYKDFLQPNIVSDVNGQYFGSDFKVHTLGAGQANQYSMFSGWDIYHSLAQLQAMLDPTAASDMAQSLVNYYGENRIMPQWGYLNLDNYAQVGDPSAALIADYYAFGATSFDTASALADLLKQAKTVNRVRPGTLRESRYGYLPQDVAYRCCNLRDFVSSLLEYDTADLALSRFAASLGDSGDATALEKRANNWQHVFDKANGLLTGKLKNHTFTPGVTPLTTRKYLEGDAYEYLWDVPNNYAGLFAKLGGNAKVGRKLRAYLSQPNGMGMHPFMANEFDLGEQFAPDYGRDPSQTQSVVNNLRRGLYRPGPFGLDNNDDLGAESSQFIWEMLGMYPENPGSGNLVFASPGFPHVIITLPYGSTITINAPGASVDKFYVKALTITGTKYSKLYVPFNQLSGGATLNWTLANRPTSWGTATADAPPSYRL